MANENFYNPSYLPGESEPFVSPYAAGLANPETIPRMYGETVEQARARVQGWEDELRQRRSTRAQMAGNPNVTLSATDQNGVGKVYSQYDPNTLQSASTQPVASPTPTVTQAPTSPVFSIGGGSNAAQNAVTQPTVQSSPMPMQQSMGKFGYAPQASIGKGGSSYSSPYGFSGQPRYGRPNQYANTVRPWDNASIMGPSASEAGGKGGKGGSSYGYPVARTNYQYNTTGSGKGAGSSTANQLPDANQNAAPVDQPTYG